MKLVAVLIAALMAALCAVMLYQGLSKGSLSAFVLAALCLTVMIFAVRGAMRKSGDIPMIPSGTPLREALSCGVAATLGGGLAMYQDHEALWHAPLVGLAAGAVLFVCLRFRRKSDA